MHTKAKPNALRHAEVLHFIVEIRMTEISYCKYFVLTATHFRVFTRSILQRRF